MAAPQIKNLRGLHALTIKKQALAYAHGAPPAAFANAQAWYASPDWELRFFAVIVLGKLAAQEPRALAFLHNHCGDDPDWRVNEGLAMAFDSYCAGVGYDNALPVIKKWLKAKKNNLRRAVSEGLRPWTASTRPVFAKDPPRAIDLLSTLIDDDSDYVLKSAGNALRDIWRKHPALVIDAVRAWRTAKPASKSRLTVAKHALKDAALKDKSLQPLVTA